MATYRLEAKVISRAKGRSATASAAYRAGAMIEDERTGLVFDYTGKRGVLHSEILAPDNTPSWMLDRSALWNAVERVEQRRDAQLARDFILSLPHELTHEQRVDLMRDFLAVEFVGRGMIADFSIHAPDRRSDERNHHAHVMVTMRELTGGGFGLKNRDWNRTELLEEWREQWAECVNRHLDLHGHEARVDHRSLEDQGLDREPEPKQGPIATEMERNGRDSHAGDDRRATKARNEERDALAREAAELDATLIFLDPDRPRGAAFEDVREATEAGARKRHGSSDLAFSNGGMVAQQAEAMRRFRRNSLRLEHSREAQAGDVKTGGTEPATPDERGAPADIDAYYKGRRGMGSEYNKLRSEQSKAGGDKEAPRQSPGSESDRSPGAGRDAAKEAPPAERPNPLRWSLDQSMPAQNAAANRWAAEAHSRRRGLEAEGKSTTAPGGVVGDGSATDKGNAKSQDKAADKAADRAAERDGEAQAPSFRWGGGASPQERANLKREQSEKDTSGDKAGSEKDGPGKDGDKPTFRWKNRDDGPDLDR